LRGSLLTSRGLEHHCILPTRARVWRRYLGTCEILTTAPGGCSRSTGRGRCWDGHVRRRRLKEMPLLAKVRSSPKASAACSRLPIRPSRSSAGCCALSSPVGISNHRQRSDPKSIFLDYHDTSPFERVSYPRQLRTWKVVHRHADPITTPQPAESMIQE
jgi:hypothetical protein